MDTSLLTEDERWKLKELVGEEAISNMFGDGMEHDYVCDGFPAWKGVNNMSDIELLKEAGHYDPNVDITPEQIAAAWKRELQE